MNTTETTGTQLINLPVVPLRGTTAFPHTLFRLNIQTDDHDYSAINEALSGKGDHELLLLTQKDILDDEPGITGFYETGVIAEVEQVLQGPENARGIVLSCVCRAHVLHLSSDDEGFRALVIRNEEPEMPLTDEGKDLVYRLAHLISTENELRGKDALKNAYLAVVSTEDLGKTADCIASALLNDYRHRQTILDCFDIYERADALCSVLQEEFEWAACEEKIESSVRASMEESHKEYYLRERLKAIQNELGDEEDDDEIRDYQKQIDDADLPDEVREKLEKELGRLAKTPYGAAESTVLRNYLDICLEIPFGKTATEKISVTEAREVLDREHDGLKEVKERILEYIAVRQISDNVKGQILCLVGPPGVGKTSIALSIARAMKRPAAKIALGGIRDEADIRGHRKTYVAAQPGRIVDALSDAGVMNPVMILDEIDKLSASPMGDPASALLEVLDPEQNKVFRDHYTEIPMDLSDCVFIATANYYDQIPAPLVDRMEIIEVSSYTENEKCAIALHHLLPKQLAQHGLAEDAIKITEPAMREIIRLYTREAGVRELERRIAALCRKVAMRTAEGKQNPVTIYSGKLKPLLGNPKYSEEKPEQTDLVGVVNGLAYTTVGGDVLEVEVLANRGTGKIEMTGSLGDVMKESAKIAVSLVRSLAAVHGIDENFYKENDLHIHFPEGAVPKDGPSAGVTMTCAIFSALSGLPARHDLAMTGEITLRGKVLPIGGLKEKSMAAYRAGIKTVLIPRENLRDLDEIDAEVKKHLTFVPCDTIEDILSRALVGYGQEPQPAKRTRKSLAPTTDGRVRV